MERLPYPDEREQAQYAHHYQPQGGRMPGGAEDRRPGATSGGGVYAANNPPLPPQQSAFPDQEQYQFDDGRLATASKKNANDSSLSVEQGTTSSVKKKQFRDQLKIDKKWQRRLYWIVPLSILAIVLVVLFEVYKKDFERWVQPLADWLKAREGWSWVIPTAILVILSFPPLFGHEIVQLVVGLTYPLSVAVGIACAGAVIGEAACFIVFKYGFTWWVEKKIKEKVNWAAVARVTQEAGFRGVLVIRYSIVPPHLANPLFSCTGMAFWLYMSTVILSLPKSIVFVILGTPSSEGSKGAKYGKVAAIAIVVIITLFASMWIRKKMAIATREIEAERGIVPAGGDEELGMLNKDKSPHTGAGGAGVGGMGTVHAPGMSSSGVARVDTSSSYQAEDSPRYNRQGSVSVSEASYHQGGQSIGVASPYPSRSYQGQGGSAPYPYSSYSPHRQ